MDLWGPVERGTLDISNDGEYVVVGGTGIGLYYFADCSGRSGSGEVPTWYKYFGINDFLTVHMSSDGSYVAAGGRNNTWEGFVMFYKNANVAPYPTEPDWCSWDLSSPITDLAVSDDGYAVVAIDELVIRTLYYWGNATTLAGNPEPTWTNDGAFSCVDMSADGDEVVAGTSPLMPCGLHFWADARKRSGPDQEENWTKLTGEIVFDVAISDDGGVIAATTEMIPLAMVSPTKAVIDSYYKAYFFKSDGTMIDEFGLLQFSNVVSMSGDGRITAVGGGIGLDSLYVFELILDITPPLIENVHQTPLPDNVYDEDVVMVYANVTDDLSGVKKVILNYTIDDETWFAFEMDNPEGNLYNHTIQGYEYCTTVTYMIMAEDNFNNTSTTEEMGYHVIPEFSPQTILPLFIVATLLMLVIYKRKFIHRKNRQ
jgi:hypothetical protein